MSCTPSIIQHPAFGKLAWRDIIGLLPEDRIVEALADKDRNTPDSAAWSAVVDMAQQRAANAFGSGKVPEEFSDAVRYALRIFAAEILFIRRGFHGDEKNPFAQQARDQEKRLRELAKGDALPDETGGTAYTEPMVTATMGNMM
jgi:hypothetical protein